MDPRIRFETKEESNARREREFIAMMPGERFALFLRDIELNPPDISETGEAKGNFIIRRAPHGVRN